MLAHTDWTASGTYEVVHFGSTSLREGGGYHFPTVDAAGRQLAFSITGVLGPGVDPFGNGPDDWIPALAVVDLATGGYRELRWPAGDQRGNLREPQHLSFSPDGTRLSFVNVHDSDGTELFDVYELDLATATSLADATLVGEALDAAYGPDGTLHGVVRDGGERRFVVLQGPGSPLGAVPLVMELTTTAAHTLLARTEDAWFRHVDGEKWTDTGWAGWHD